MEQFMNYSASFFFRGDTLPAPRNRHKIHQLLGGVVSNGCNHEIECVGRFVGSKSFAKVWRNLGYGDLKTKMKKVLKEVSWRLKAMLPQVSDKEWTNMVQVSFIDDEILQSLFGRTVLLYSASTVKRIISKNAEDRVILQADHWQKDKKGKWMEKPLTGAMMAIAPQVAYILGNEESYSAIFAPDQHHPRKFIVGATHSMLVFKIEDTMGGFQEGDANSITAESYNIAQQLNNICTKTPFKDVVSVCVPARARRHRGGDLDTTGHLKNMNMLLMYTTTGTSDMDKELIIQIEVPNGVWKAVMENTNQLTADELARPYMHQMDALVASPLEKEVAIELEIYLPKPVLNVDIHYDCDGAQWYRNSNHATGFSTMTKCDAVIHYKKESGLTGIRDYVFWGGMFPGSDTFDNLNGYLWKLNGFKILRKDNTAVMVDFAGDFWGMPFHFPMDSKAFEAMCGGYPTRWNKFGVFDMPGRPKAERIETVDERDESYTGGTNEERTTDFLDQGYGINLFLIGGDLLKLAQTYSKRIIGIELWVKFWPNCLNALLLARGDLLTLDTEVRANCGKVLSMGQERYKYDREKKDKGGSWAVPGKKKVPDLYCPSHEKECSAFVTYLRSAFYRIPLIDEDVGVVGGAAAGADALAATDASSCKISSSFWWITSRLLTSSPSFAFTVTFRTIFMMLSR